MSSQEEPSPKILSQSLPESTHFLTQKPDSASSSSLSLSLSRSSIESGTSSPVPSASSSPVDSPTLKSYSHQQIQQQYDDTVATANQLPKLTAATIPSELILHIFKFITSTSDLKSCILVCKSWCSCGVEILWHKPVFSGNALVKLLITISRPTQTFPYALLIRRLNFSFLGENVSDAILSRLNGCERLERLTLGGCKRLTDIGLIGLINKAEGLVALDVSDIMNLTDAVVELVGQRCRRLQGLNVSLCKKITDTGVIAVASRCRSLRRIKLSGCENVTDNSIVLLAENCPHLLELDLTNCNQITNNAIQPVLERCAQLRELRLNSCTNLTDEAFTKSMPSFFEQLRILDLTSCALITDQTLLKIVYSAPKLRNLVLAKCGNITDEGVNHITRLGKHLHYLHLGHCSRITDHSITNLARHCTRLRYLDLACCVQLTDASVHELSHLPKLKRIGLVKCANITDSAIYALIDHRVVAHTLERVHLSYCINLTITAVLELVNCCYRLTHLSLTGVPAFLRSDLQRLCRPPPKEFNQHQRQVFCVFSGKGVKELRQYLNNVATGSVRPRITDGGPDGTDNELNITNVGEGDDLGLDDLDAEGTDLVINMESETSCQHTLRTGPDRPGLVVTFYYHGQIYEIEEPLRDELGALVAKLIEHNNVIDENQKNSPDSPPPSHFDPTTQHVFRSIKRGFKYMVIGAASIVAIGYLTVRGGHFYVEHFHCATPSMLPSKARDSLRWAYLREEIDPDLNMAQSHLNQALLIAQEQADLPLTHPIIVEIVLRIANNSVRLGNLYEARLEYQKLLQALTMAGGDENIKKAIDVVRRMSKICITMQDYKSAEKYLEWAIGILTAGQSSIINNYRYINLDLVQCNLMLAGIFAKREQFEKALSLYLGTLKKIKQQLQSSSSPENTDKDSNKDHEINWNCWEGIIMGHLGEIFYAMGKEDEALGWLQQGLKIAKSGVDDDNVGERRDCDECAGVISNNLGLIYEKDGKLWNAGAFYTQAFSFAEKANDLEGLEEASRNLERIGKELEKIDNE
ncbi:8878_t:CDS:2 [Ambispora gerdemannii]|uniref:8878_t:CDS:1 n=1 Tax=Ambispora gerdemannii TaxID=144530 RepID=A0A9N8VK60_9GLOM|nr:8878_t:CDS:2 [Ambispora gerdemannii]